MRSSVVCTLGVLSMVLRLSVSNHAPDLFIDTDLRIAAAVLKSMCTNFAECGIDPYIWSQLQCCLKCSCEPSCTITHSCCPESGYHPTGEVSYTSGRDGMVCRNGVFVGTSQGIFRDPEYEFLEQCPEDTPADVKMSCEDSYTKPNVSLIDSLPLYDTVRGINYANMYCAMCNNASTEDLVPWGPSIRCVETIDSSSMTLSQFDDTIFNNECSVTFEPPDTDVTGTICFKDVITTCNVTGNWVMYDVTAEVYCGVLDMLFVPIDIYSRTYKNIFCAQCNGEVVTVDFTTLCPFETTHDFSTAFTTLLQLTVNDLNKDTGSDSGQDLNECPGNHAYDPLEGRCMPVYCFSPDILDTQTSQCKSLFGKTSKAIGSHTFSIVFRETANFSTAQTEAQAILTIALQSVRFFCTITIFYQTNLHVIDTLDDVILNGTEETITGLFINVRYRVYDEFPHDARDRTSASIESFFTNTSLYDYMGPETFDPGMLLYIVNVSGVESRDDVVLVNLTVDTPQYLFTNPYNQTVVIGEENAWNKGCVVGMYKSNYLRCPAFRYNVTRFSRISSGLSLIVNDADVMFNFNEFKTGGAYSTDVSICIQAVINKVPSLFSCEMTNSLSGFCEIVMFMCALVLFQ